MGMHSSGNNNYRRKKRRYVSDINVTPLVDVMLVLLIIFMITSPMLVGGVEVDLPQTSSPVISGQYKPLVLSLDENGKIYLFETEIKREELPEKLKAITKENQDSRIFVRGDKKIPYGIVAEIMTLIQNSGYSKVSLISEID